MNLAPNGRESNLTPEQYSLVRTTSFKKWFGDWEKSPKTASKVVDENGEPLVLFHGTDVNFNVYDLNKIGEGSDLLGKGIYLTENKEIANFYANLVAKKRYIKGYEQGIFGTETPLYEKDADIKAEKHKVIYDFFVNAKNIVYLNEININNDIKEILIESISFMFGDKSEDIINSRIDFVDKNYDKIKNYRGKIIYLIEQFFDAKNEVLEYIKNKYDCIVFEPTNEFEGATSNYKNYVVFEPNQIKLADGSNTTFDANNDDIRFEGGGNVENKEVYKKWKSLVNMSKSELENFYNSQEGKDAGLSSKEASGQGISSGRESARWIMKMKETPMKDWTPTMWKWAKKQISFISRMSGNRGDLYDEKGNKTRKHTSLLIWGNNPKKYEQGANIENETNKNKMDKTIEISTSEYKFSEFYEWFKNYVPASLYNEEWVSEMRTLNNLIKDNNVEEKITFTDDRLVLISNFALCYSDVIKGGLREWWIVRRYLQQYTDNNSIQGTDLLEFVDKYIGYTYTDATLKDESLSRFETLKSVLSEYVKDDSIMIPYFVKNEIMSGVKEQGKEIIVRKEAPKKENVDLPEEEKWQGLKDFAEMMTEDAEGEALEKWQGLYEFCELMLEK